MLTCFDDIYARGTLRSDAPTCTRMHAYDARNGTMVACISDHVERRLASKCVPLVFLVVGLFELTLYTILSSLKQLCIFLIRTIQIALQVATEKDINLFCSIRSKQLYYNPRTY